MGRLLTIFSVAVLAFFAGVTASFFTLPFWVIFAINAAKDGPRSDWLGFSGSVVAGVVALAAAIIAWFAVQQQIKAQEQAEERASKRLDEQREIAQGKAKYAAKIVLTQTVHVAAAVMNVTGQVLEAATEPREVGAIGYIEPGRIGLAKAKLDKLMVQLRATMSHFSVAEAWKDLGSEDKGNYLIVTSTLHTVANVYENPPPIPYLKMVANQHATMSKFALYLLAFDTELAEVYERDSKI